MFVPATLCVPFGKVAYHAWHGLSKRWEACGVLVASHTKQPLNIMTTLKMKGTWNETKGKLKQRYAQLTDNDLLFEEGKEDELLGRLQKRTGETKERIRQFIEEV